MLRHLSEEDPSERTRRLPGGRARALDTEGRVEKFKRRYGDRICWSGSTMAVPERKMSRSNARHRRSQRKAAAPDLVPTEVDGKHEI